MRQNHAGCTISNANHDGTYEQTRGQSDDAALLVEETRRIYSTPTLKGFGVELKSVCIDCRILLQYLRFNIYTRNLKESYSNTNSLQIIETKRKLPNPMDNLESNFPFRRP
jgi:hypothetical protein